MRAELGTQGYRQAQPSKATAKRNHQTQPPSATIKGNRQAQPSNASTKRYHQTLALMGDASRVGGREERKELNTNATTAHNSCIFSRRGTRRPH